LIAGRDVLEVACGEGYGSALLAGRARSVTAFDASPDAVAHARRVYAGKGVRYQEATVRSFFTTCPDQSFDVIVAFEIIEHLSMEDQALLLDSIQRVLRPDGLALISTPDKLLYSDRPLAKNAFHVREYYRDEFEAELRQRFAHFRILDQALFTGCALVSPAEEGVRGVQMVWTDLLRAQGTYRPRLKTTGEYMVAVVAKVPLPDTPSLLLADFSRKLIAEGLQAERRTADRLARELEEARRAWEDAMAEGRRLTLTAEERRRELESQLSREHETLARLREAEAAAKSARSDLAAQLLNGSPNVRRDDARLHAENQRLRLAVRTLRQSKGQRFEMYLRNLLRQFRTIRQSWGRPATVLRQLRDLRRLRRESNLVDACGIFDREFYLTENGDVARSGIDPVEHFLLHGAVEGRDPHPLFDVSFYLQEYADVASSGTNPLLHFLLHGWKERRKPHPLFDTGFYLDRNPEVAGSGVNPLAHYLEHGAAEARDPNPGFDTRAYLHEHPEAAAIGCNPLVHAIHSQSARGTIPPPITDTAGLAAWRADMEQHPRRALVIDDTLITPDRDSGSITTLELMKGLQLLGYAVTFVPRDLKHIDLYTGALETAGFWCLSRRVLSSVQELLQNHGSLFGLIVLCRATTAYQLIDSVRAHCPEAVLLFETIDLHYLRGEREAALTGSESGIRAAELTKANELDVVRRSDLTLVHSVVEREMLSREVPEASIYHLPYVLDVYSHGGHFESRRDIVFIGGFLHRPNVDAVIYFVKEVFPLIRKELPGVRFLIIGSDPSPEVLQLGSDDIVVTGYVERLQPILDACRLTVAPLRYGAGYKGKVAMSMAHGVPGVLSEIAAEGMELEHEVQVLIADSPTAYAAEVVRLYRDPDLWSRLSQAGLRFVTERFSRQAARDHLERVLRMAGADPREDSRTRGEATAKIATERRQPGRAIFPSRFMQALHGRAGLRFDSEALVPHGVDFHHTSGAPRADRSQFVDSRVLRLLVAGRIVNFKGVHTALEALPAIVQGVPHLDVQLTIVGDAQDVSYLERLRQIVDDRRLGERVHFILPKTEEQLFTLFQQHDLYLFPSLFEPFALTLILALEAGIPTVASAVGGNVDIITDHRTGLLFPAGDSAALAEAVIELASNSSLRQRLSDNARSSAETFTVNAMMDHIEKSLQDLPGGDRSADARP
jgi:glycosyltransferase involved in cell wall biosynthesis/SAM-dependent methyltransferase